MRLKSRLAIAALALSMPTADHATEEKMPRLLIQPLFAVEQGETRAVLLAYDGQVTKRYAPGFSDANRFISWSMAKTITGMLVGELVADGRLALDSPAPVAEWQGDARRAITLRRLLQMSSGLSHVEVGDPVENSDTNQAEFVSSTAAMAAYGIAKPLETAPGVRFEYSTLTSIILSEIITRTLTDSRDPRVRAQAYKDFADARLFRPAGVTSAFMEFDGAGTQVGGSLVHMTLDDWGRMGTLLLDGRGAGGVQVIAPDWLAYMKTPSPTRGDYGAQTWLNRPTGLPGKNSALFPGKGPDTIVGMDGHLGQAVLAGRGYGANGPYARERSVVLVRLGNTPDGDNAKVKARLGDVFEALLPDG